MGGRYKTGKCATNVKPDHHAHYIPLRLQDIAHMAHDTHHTAHTRGPWPQTRRSVRSNIYTVIPYSTDRHTHADRTHQHNCSTTEHHRRRKRRPWRACARGTMQITAKAPTFSERLSLFERLPRHGDLTATDLWRWLAFMPCTLHMFFVIQTLSWMPQASFRSHGIAGAPAPAACARAPASAPTPRSAGRHHRQEPLRPRQPAETP
jgi:hypothetical protein